MSIATKSFALTSPEGTQSFYFEPDSTPFDSWVEVHVYEWDELVDSKLMSLSEARAFYKELRDECNYIASTN